MYLFVVFLSFAGLALAFPVADENTPAKEFQQELQKSLEPVVSDLRSMAKNAGAGIQDFAKAAVESQNNILEGGKQLLSPVDETDRANIRATFMNRMRSLRSLINSNARQLVQRALRNSKPVLESEKEVVKSYKNAAETLQKKYLTEDGQNLIRKLTSG